MFIAALAVGAPAFAQTAYFARIPDLPLAPGLTEDADRFGGRYEAERAGLILASARGDVGPEAVERFYAETLSALGWSIQIDPRGEEMAFLRGRERLVLVAAPADGGTLLRVRLIARQAPPDAD